MISKFKKQLEPIIAIIAQPFLSWNPAVLTILSLVFAVLFFFGILNHIYWLSIVSLLGFVFDALDGYVARKQNKVTKYGGFLDSTLDRIADFFFITSFGFGHLVSWELTTLALGTSFLISYMRSRGELAFRVDKPMAEGLMQRTERIIFIYAAFILFLLMPNFQLGKLDLLSLAFIIIVLLNTLTIFQRFYFFAKIEKNKHTLV